jgi:glycine oxidase
MASNRPAHDAIVIGGGCLGQSIALELGLRGAKTLLLYPKTHCPDSATLAAGAMIGAFGELRHDQTGQRDEQKLLFRLQSQQMYPSWLAKIQDLSGVNIFCAKGIFMIANAHGKHDEKNLRYIKTKLDYCHRRSEWVEPQDVPGLSPSKTFPTSSALFIPDDLSVDSENLLRAIGYAISATRACTVQYDRVCTIKSCADGKAWQVVTERGSTLTTQNLVVCAGARVPAVLGESLLLSLKLPTLEFVKGIGCVVSGAPAMPHSIRTTNRSDACGVHVVPREGGQLYLGASSHPGYACSAARGITPGEAAAILGDISHEINRVLRDTSIEEMRFGLRPVASHDMPLIGRTQLPGLFLATATFRTGILMSPLIAQMVANEILDPGIPSSNPFPADAAWGQLPDLNVSNLYADRGLYAYNQWRQSGDLAAKAKAIESWQTYLEISKDRADDRIKEMLQLICSGQSVQDWVW